ncbi:hypothetical protein [Marininema halotolerans]|uniref:Uncharacterized protein n=1 Tax=Marininema halotolerans TaxID=1155944 RepID=A0A1I6UQW3_9BACL|nr:hypothetical protein [Marininema halotolerans]SFT03724.1 hypothetical protein SAMN05444972_1199 [Marininema halotolerans]
MNRITKETRRESYELVQGSLENRQQVVFQELAKCPRLTANELAARLWRQGKVPKPDRNFVHPRLTELVKTGQVAVVGKKTCTISSKKCAIYVAVSERGGKQGSLF